MCFASRGAAARATLDKGGGGAVIDAMTMESQPHRSRFDGEVVGIYIAAREGEPTRRLEHVQALSGRGLEGDRYFGTRDAAADPSKRSEVTLIESEALQAVKRDYDLPLEAGESRRNIITRDVALNHLVGCTFQVGEATLEGVRLCEPCQYVEGLTRPGVRKALIHRGGLRARIVGSGAIRVGDSIRPRA
jgi:MOSC domain-containing protein YiiM